MIYIFIDGKNIFNNGKFFLKLEEIVEDINFFVEKYIFKYWFNNWSFFFVSVSYESKML